MGHPKYVNGLGFLSGLRMSWSDPRSSGSPSHGSLRGMGRGCGRTRGTNPDVSRTREIHIGGTLEGPTPRVPRFSLGDPRSPGSRHMIRARPPNLSPFPDGAPRPPASRSISTPAPTEEDSLLCGVRRGDHTSTNGRGTQKCKGGRGIGTALVEKDILWRDKIGPGGITE